MIHAHAQSILARQGDGAAIPLVTSQTGLASASPSQPAIPLAGSTDPEPSERVRELLMSTEEPEGDHRVEHTQPDGHLSLSKPLPSPVATREGCSQSESIPTCGSGGARGKVPVCAAARPSTEIPNPHMLGTDSGGVVPPQGDGSAAANDTKAQGPDLTALACDAPELSGVKSVDQTALAQNGSKPLASEEDALQVDRPDSARPCPSSPAVADVPGQLPHPGLNAAYASVVGGFRAALLTMKRSSGEELPVSASSRDNKPPRAEPGLLVRAAGAPQSGGTAASPAAANISANRPRATSNSSSIQKMG